MCPFGVLCKSNTNDTGISGMWLNIPQAWIVHIAKGSSGQPLTSSQFLAVTTLNIFGEIVTVILGLTKRHLQHEEPLRGWLKPKCRKAQRHHLASINGIDDASTINRIPRKTVGMPREDANTVGSLNLSHHHAEHLTPRCLCAFRLLKFLQDFKIFFTRQFTKLKQLRFDRHHLAVIILSTLTRVEKIFWFDIHMLLDTKQGQVRPLRHTLPIRIHGQPPSPIASVRIRHARIRFAQFFRSLDLRREWQLFGINLKNG